MIQKFEYVLRVDVFDSKADFSVQTVVLASDNSAAIVEIVTEP